MLPFLPLPAVEETGAEVEDQVAKPLRAIWASVRQRHARLTDGVLPRRHAVSGLELVLRDVALRDVHLHREDADLLGVRMVGAEAARARGGRGGEGLGLLRPARADGRDAGRHGCVG